MSDIGSCAVGGTSAPVFAATGALQREVRVLIPHGDVVYLVSLAHSDPAPFSAATLADFRAMLGSLVFG